MTSPNITITKSNSGTLTTYTINHFVNVIIQDQSEADAIADITGSDQTALVLKSLGTQMKISFDYRIVNESANVVTAGSLTLGTSSGGNGSVTLNDTNQAWTVNQFANEQLQITTGTGNGTDKYNIVSNTATQLTINGGWNHGTPDGSSTYTILITTAVGQAIYLLNQFSSITTTSSLGVSNPIFDTYQITFNYNEARSRTFIRNGVLVNLIVPMDESAPTVFNGHMEFIVGTVV